MALRLLTIIVVLALTGCTKTGGEPRPSGKPGEAPAAAAPNPGK